MFIALVNKPRADDCEEMFLGDCKISGLMTLNACRMPCRVPETGVLELPKRGHGDARQGRKAGR